MKEGPKLAGTADESIHIHLLDLTTKKMTRLTEGQFIVDQLTWSPDGKRLAFSTLDPVDPDNDYLSDIYLVSISSAKTTPLVVRKGRDDSPRFSPDSKQIAYTTTRTAIGEHNSVYVEVIDLDTGETKNLTANIGDRTYGLFGWSRDGESVYFRKRHGTTLQLFSASADGVHQVSQGDKVYRGFSFSRLGNERVAFVSSDPVTPNDIYIANLPDFVPELMVEVNPQLSAFDMPTTEIVRWTSVDGLEIEGVLVLPKQTQSHSRYPLITVAHGGPAGAFTVGFSPQISSAMAPVQFDPYPPQLFASRGYAVFMPNIRGSSGYGAEFLRANHRDWGGADLADLISGVDYLVDKGLVDPKRMAITGWSYGGFISAMAISQSDKFHAAQVGAGLTNITSMYGTTNLPQEVEAGFGAKPWEDPNLYRNRSPVTHATKISVPTLIQHGEFDRNVPISQGEELYAVLKALDVPTEFARYPRSGHVVMEPRLGVDVWQRQLKWYDKWLQ